MWRKGAPSPIRRGVVTDLERSPKSGTAVGCISPVDTESLFPLSGYAFRADEHVYRDAQPFLSRKLPVTFEVGERGDVRNIGINFNSLRHGRVQSFSGHSGWLRDDSTGREVYFDSGSLLGRPSRYQSETEVAYFSQPDLTAKASLVYPHKRPDTPSKGSFAGHTPLPLGSDTRFRPSPNLRQSQSYRYSSPFSDSEDDMSLPTSSSSNHSRADHSLQASSRYHTSRSSTPVPLGHARGREAMAMRYPGADLIKQLGPLPPLPRLPYTSASQWPGSGRTHKSFADLDSIAPLLAAPPRRRNSAGSREALDDPFAGSEGFENMPAPALSKRSLKRHPRSPPTNFPLISDPGLDAVPFPSSSGSRDQHTMPALFAGGDQHRVSRPRAISGIRTRAKKDYKDSLLELFPA